ncbi:hypothetical protein [Parashewanella tropica]|uniref:hypothetical protein n=1 Tax=Parashewanella tropica TaxID=2547970 RepID=UPI001059528D|nr:hypothetical protein [Parashewanella tropica]
MSDSYQPQSWNYHFGAPKAGRKLWLIKPEEINFLIPLVLKTAKEHLDPKKSHLFIDPTSNYKINSDSCLHLSKLLNEVLNRKKSNKEFLPQLGAANEDINRFFSDDGWRHIRKEYQQILKRNKKSHIEIPNDILQRLKEYQQTNGFSDYGQTIDELLELAKVNVND